MLKVSCIALLFVASRVVGQIPTSSPALDPDFVVLQPKEEFAGRYANQGVGGDITTVAPLQWDVPEGAVFLKNVDTVGYSESDIRRLKPSGAFRQDQNFSLFSRALYRVNGLSFPNLLFSETDNDFPIIAGNLYKVVGGEAVAFFFPNDSEEYTDSIFYAYTLEAFTFATERSAFTAADFNGNSFNDFIALETSREGQGDSTHIAIWYNEDTRYRGDSIFNLPIIPASVALKIPQRLNPFGRREMYAADIDKDGVTDFSFFGGNTDGGSKNGIATVFGKTNNGKWDIDTVIVLLDSTIHSFLFMDFLLEDGIQDLVIGTDDTIYCFSGHRSQFLRTGFSLSDADFKIPSPAKLDPQNFKGNGNGMLYEWGWWMHNAGNVNGSGQHSLAVLCYLSPDTSQLGGPTYCFIYSGGEAADEKADAIVADNSSIYVIFLTLDTVQTSDGSISDILLGDPFHTNGRTGKLYYFKGRTDIPHKPNPHWSVSKEFTDRDVFIECNQIIHDNSVHVSIHGAAQKAGTLILRDVLGRRIREVTVPNVGTYERLVTLPIDGITNGSYVLQYIENNRSATKQIFIIH